MDRLSTLHTSVGHNALKGFSGGGVGSCCLKSSSKKGGGGVATRASYPPSNTYASSQQDHHAVLGVSRFATKQEIKKSYRRLALELHPDVCTGDHCSTRFQQVQRAYEALIQERTLQFGEFEDELSENLENFMGVGDNNWEEWEEWMGWEGAGTYDYSNHINPNI